MRDRDRTAGIVALQGAAVFLATFTLIGVVAELRGRTLDTSLWWVDLHELPTPVRIAILAAFSLLLYGWVLRRVPGPLVRGAISAGCGLFALVALRDSLAFFDLVATGRIHARVGLPLSLFTMLLLLGMAVLAWRESGLLSTRSGRRVGGVLVAAGAWAVAFPLAQMLFFGTTDYRRPADVAVIFGARVYADGRPSPLLADRIRTGVELYRSDLVPLLIVSGGDGADGYNEARVMRDVAVAAGVQPGAIVIDPRGDSTEATVANVTTLIAGRGDLPHPARVIAVSQAYHLPRIQLSFANAGLDVLTVPATELTPISEMPLLVAREVPAFWGYYLRVALG
jgi:vancomycin permeability regulator SanA